MAFAKLLFRTCLLMSLCLALPSVSFADEDFDLNAKGMVLTEMEGRTLVGVTRDKSAVFSVYIDPNGTADFHHSNDSRATAKWRRQDRYIICFTGIVAENPNDEVCKRAPELGRGLDWTTVILETKDGETTYARKNPDEERGSSQMVYSFKGKVEVDQESYVEDLTKWVGHLIVGRTLKDKEAWFANFDSDGGVDFVFASGKRYKGNYTAKSDEICMDFPENPETSGCRRPTIKDGKIRWVSTKDGGATSEIVFMKQMQTSGPQDAMVLADKDTGFFTPSPDRRLAVSANNSAGAISVYNLLTGKRLGSVLSPAPVDIEISPDGKRFGTVHGDGVEVFDTATGDFITAVERPANANTFRELAFMPGNQIVVGDEGGTLNLISLTDGKQVKAVEFAGEEITNMAFNTKGQLLVGDGAGNLAIYGPDLAPVSGLKSKGEGKALGMAMSADGKYALALTKDSLLHMFDLQANVFMPVKSVKIPSDKAWSVEFAASGTLALVTMDTEVGLVSVPDLTVKSRVKTGTDTLSRVAFVGDSPAMLLADTTGKLRIFAPDRDGIRAWTALRDSTDAGTKLFFMENPGLKAINATASAGQTLRTESQKLYDAGECATYEVIRSSLRLEDRKSDCERAIVLRKARAEFDAAITAQDCDKAAGIMVDTATDQPKVDLCRTVVAQNAAKAAFAAAIAAKDCAKVRELQGNFNNPDAADECEFDKVLSGDSARAMYLAAVTFDTGGNRERATRLYTEIMTRFAEDDVAIDAANRLTALADLAKIEAGQAALAAEQATAIKAAEDRAAAAEKAAIAATAEAERQRVAREDEARRADQARTDAANAAAAAATQDVDRCPGIYPGQVIKREVKILFMDGLVIYRVEGVDHRSGYATLRDTSNGYLKEEPCSNL